MTKGKYAVRACRRREDESVQSEIGTYQHHVRRLTAEVKELTGKLADERAARKEEVRRLGAMLDEGLSPELIALREEVERQRRRADQATATQRNVQEMQARRAMGLLRLLRDGLGLTHVEAAEVWLMLDPEARVEDGEAPLLGDWDARPGRLTRQQIQGIQAARGTRHSVDVVKLLRDMLDAVAAKAEQP